LAGEYYSTVQNIYSNNSTTVAGINVVTLTSGTWINIKHYDTNSVICVKRVYLQQKIKKTYHVAIT